jgi:hypothetical protein
LIATEPTKTNTIKNLLIYEDPSEKEDNQIDLDLNIELSMTIDQGSNFIAATAAIAVEGEQNAVDHCGNDGNFLPYSAIFILFRC